MESYWEDSTLPAPVKFENHLGYTNANNSDDEDYGFHGSKKKLTRDPLSHRIIEKRRRDRMNSCLADLSRLIPHEYMKKGRGRVEKTEIIEMAIRRIKHLMSHPPCQDAECRADDMDTAGGPPSVETLPPSGVPAANHQNGNHCSSVDSLADSYRLGFAECLNETVHFLVQVEGLMVDPLCTRLRSHLTNHCDNILQNESLRSRLCCPNGLPEEKPPIHGRATPPAPPSLLQANSLPQQEVPESGDPSGRLQDLSYPSGNSLMRNQNHRQGGACGSCATQESSSDASTGGHTNNLSPTSWNSERPMESDASAAPSYKFKHRIQKRFERTEMTTENRIQQSSAVTPSTLVPIFALAPSGCHYYASWIEAGAIPSYLACSAESARSPRWLSAHSVTISVDFSLSRAGT